MGLEIGNLKLFGLDLRSTWQWWLDGLREAKPAWLDAVFLKPSPEVAVEWDGSAVTIRRRVVGGRWEPVVNLESAALEVAGDEALLEDLLSGGVARELVQCELILPEDRVMVRQVDLPPVDARRLREMLVFQLPRLTPFSADKLYYDAAVAGSEVVMAAIPRSTVDPLIAQVEKVTGLQVSALRFAGTDAAARMNLFGERRVANRWWRRLNGNSLLLVILLGAMAVASIMPVYAQRQHVIERKQQIFAVHATVAESMATREILEDSLHTLSATLQARQSRPPTLVLAELSRIIPDNIFLTELRVQAEELHIAGSGNAVVELIDLLNASPLFEDARFTSSVNRNARTGQDQFTATMLMVPEGERG